MFQNNRNSSPDQRIGRGPYVRETAKLGKKKHRSISIGEYYFDPPPESRLQSSQTNRNVSNMSNYTPLFGSILTSTIWTEDNETRLVWITMLAMADASGYVGASIPGLASVARVDLKACEKAIDKFLGPDKYSRSPEFEGRRIEVADGGWKLLNYDKQRERAAEIRNTVMTAIRMREHRAKTKKEAKGKKVTNVTEENKQFDKFGSVWQSEADSESDARQSDKEIRLIANNQKREILEKYGVNGQFAQDVIEDSKISANVLRDLAAKIHAGVTNPSAFLATLIREQMDSEAQPDKPTYTRPER